MNIDELAERGTFQGFFQFEFEESLRRRLQFDRLDLYVRVDESIETEFYRTLPVDDEV